MLKQIALAGLLTSFSSLAHSAIYLEIPGVPGESENINYKNQIEVTSWSWGTSSGNRTTCVEDIVIDKRVDKASPVLLMDQIIGKNYPSAKLKVTRTGGMGESEYVTLELENVQMVSHETSHGSDEVPQESLSLNFEKIKYTYRPHNQDGSLGTPIIAEILGGNCK